MHASKGEHLPKSKAASIREELEELGESKICEASFHGQLPINYLLGGDDSSILMNSVETGVLRKSLKSHQQFRCEGCDRSYTRIYSLKRHQTECDSFWENLQGETEWFHRQKFYCSQCGRGYKRLDTLRRHQRLACEKESVSTPSDNVTF
ncbi:uncharacterized protein LOC105663816 [Megachile rotundata]|uniref:uncharacterized protein LOC105663816 n=1 Tax=Megachile rotundata TaxID=143995 RepID=UPI003FD35A01